MLKIAMIWQPGWRPLPAPATSW